MSDKREQAIYELMLLYPNFKCTCDEVVRETEIFQAKGHYHHCMLWLVSHAIERSFMYCDGYRLVNGKMIKPPFTSFDCNWHFRGEDKMSIKEKLIRDLALANEPAMTNFVQNNTDPKMEKLILDAIEGKRYLVICETCGKVFVDMPFKEYYKQHTYPEWDIWFCDATLHWAETEGNHSIYCFSDKRNYDISSSNNCICRNESWSKIHRDMKDVVAMRESLMKQKNKNKVWIKK